MDRRNVKIFLKPKRNSSGMIKNGEIILYISGRLPRAERQRHITVLTARLEAQLEEARRIAGSVGENGLPLGLTRSPVQDDDALRRWAEAINRQYYGFPMGDVRFRRQESRWGSCSARTRNIQISDRLRGGPHELLEYVLIHEIAHLGEMNHSPRFWALVARACPDYRQRRALLRQYELYLRSLPESAEER